MVQHGLLTEQTDLSPADWLVERMTTFGENVASIIPEGFDAYVRLFHPAYQDDVAGPTPIRWSEIARATGRQVHPEMQWEGIAGHPLFSGEPESKLWKVEPATGNLPMVCIQRLVETLRRHTTTPDRVWFLTWTGWGGHRLRPGDGWYGVLRKGWFGRKPKRTPERRTPLPPKVGLPGREYYLLSGPIEGALESMGSSVLKDFPTPWQSVSLWWPDDRAWIVSTEVDFPWTYIGGTRGAVDAILDHPELEALPAELHHGVDANSDRINPPPSPQV